MLCNKCGKKNSNDSNFCIFCGFKLEQKNLIIYAGFWKRFTAFIIDGMILGIGGFVPKMLGIIIIGIIFGVNGQAKSTFHTLTNILSYLIHLTLGWLYYAFFESSSKQATVGKMAMQIIVTDIDGNKISFDKATVRYWSKIISTLTFFIGYIMAGFTTKKQALHDIIADTIVIEKKG